MHSKLPMWRPWPDAWFQSLADLLLTPSSRPAAWPVLPEVSVRDEGAELVVRVPVPAVDPNSLEVRLGTESVYLSGARCEEYREERPGQTFASSFGGRFRTLVPLPSPVDLNRAQADLKDGVLEVRAPKLKNLPVSRA